MSLLTLLLVLNLGTGHRIVTLQNRDGKHFVECQLDSVDLFGGVIRIWVDNNLTKVAAADIVAIHVSDLEKGQMSWIDESLLVQAA
jgi:hypothetical protein